MDYSQWFSKMNHIVSTIKKSGGVVTELVVKGPVKEPDVSNVEKGLGIKIPSSYKKVLLEDFSYLEWNWEIPENLNLDERFEEIYGSRGVLGLTELVECELKRRELVEDIFNEQDNLYDKIWQRKLAFFDVGNGNLFAFDLMSDKEDPPVVYLNADDDELHGTVLGDNFIDFMEKWSKIGFVSGETWNLIPFLGSNGIDSEGVNAQVWRKILNL
ncbi:SMI1/KNR4 family protein [Bacillus cereus group sp. BfR-BA-01379]|uniref:SMI1/KNR4 family protein n=1 Tax=Bacillus cereus group sp. BfR-BA-01379 TaxID=2920323 RepID=UPI001F59482E|nr:SMI1/KNR4 family protein [Bacillus cereus group sp. BfR-BA-01379]